jgi:hypothetical protein
MAQAHPIPEVPVRSYFEEGGKAVIKVEIDPRVWEEVPDKAKYLFNQDLPALSEEAKSALIQKAADYTAANLEFYLLPLGKVSPDFKWAITGEAEVPLEKPDQPAAITGTWETTIPSGMAGYQVGAGPGNKVGVYIHNFLRGQALERVAVLFPGEKSYVLDLTTLSGAAAVALEGAVNESTTGGLWATFIDFIHQGFIHVIPEGLDHILFVLGVFLLSRQWKPLLLQVTAFTVAHTITLALATLKMVSVPGSIVEPIIAGSIAAVALENIFRPQYTNWRLLLVFLFGLIHGLGFASVLGDLNLPPGSLIAGLVGFNIGVEFGQLAVIAGAFLLTFWIQKEQTYRKFIVIPGSLIIGALGLWWMIQRTFGLE